MYTKKSRPLTLSGIYSSLCCARSSDERNSRRTRGVHNSTRNKRKKKKKIRQGCSKCFQLHETRLFHCSIKKKTFYKTTDILMKYLNTRALSGAFSPSGRFSPSNSHNSCTRCGVRVEDNACKIYFKDRKNMLFFFYHFYAANNHVSHTRPILDYF